MYLELAGAGEAGVLLWEMGLKLSSKDLLKEDNSSGSSNPQKTG